MGRLAVQIAAILKGKHKPTFLPNKDMGDHVVVINADKVHLTGNKWKKKLYRWHTGFPGGLKERTAAAMLERNPTQILRRAVLGMAGRRNRLRHGHVEPRLYIYAGERHPHAAQLPPSQVPPLPPAPRKRNGSFHFGLHREYYAHPASHREGFVEPPRRLESELLELWKDYQQKTT